jgi:hypothetical protein
MAPRYVNASASDLGLEQQAYLDFGLIFEIEVRA